MTIIRNCPHACFDHLISVADTPTAVIANRTGFNTVEVSWNASSSKHHPAGYEVFYQTASSSSPLSGGNVSNIEMVISDLSVREQYTIFVVSYGEEGETVLPSPHSNEVIVPAIPTITNVSVNVSSIMVSWDIPSLVPSEYIITYMCHPACNILQNISNTDSVSNEVHMYTISPLQAGTICDVNVTAVFGNNNNNNNSTDTASVSTITAGIQIQGVHVCHCIISEES